MILWTGIGWVAAVITMGCMVATQLLVGVAFQDEGYYEANGWPKLLGVLSAAVAVHRLASWRKKRLARVFIDKETGEEVVMHANDSLFFIPLRFLPHTLVVLAFVASFAT